MPTATLPARPAKLRRKPAKALNGVRRKRVARVTLDLDAEEVALHNAISAAVARDLGR